MRLYTILKNIINKISAISPVWYSQTANSISVKIGKLLIQGGYNTIQPAAANTITDKTISYPRAYSITPIVGITVNGKPEVNVCRITVGTRSTSNFVASIFASNTTDRGFTWMTIGVAS